MCDEPSSGSGALDLQQLVPITFTLLHDLSDNEFSLRSSASVSLTAIVHMCRQPQHCTASAEGGTVVFVFVTFFKSISLTMHWSNCHDHRETMVLQVVVKNLFSAPRAATHSDTHEMSRLERPRTNPPQVPPPLITAVMYQAVMKGLKSHSELARKEYVRLFFFFFCLLRRYVLIWVSLFRTCFSCEGLVDALCVT